MDRLWTIDELAERYHCSRRTLLRVIQKGYLPAIKPFGQWLVKDKDRLTLEKNGSTARISDDRGYRYI